MLHTRYCLHVKFLPSLVLRVQHRFGGIRDGVQNRGGMRDTINIEGRIRDDYLGGIKMARCAHFRDSFDIDCRTRDLICK